MSSDGNKPKLQAFHMGGYKALSQLTINNQDATGNSTDDWIE